MISCGVCLTNFNYARYLPRCLDHLIQQTRPADQIILIDDASTDESLGIMESYRACYPGLTILRNERNLGCNASINVALKEISTDFVAMCAADDWLSPNYFERMLALLQQYPEADIATCSTVVWDEDNRLQWVSGSLLAAGSRFISAREVVQLDKENRLIVFGNTVLVRTDRLRAMGGFDPQLKHAADSFVWYSLAFTRGMCHDPEPLANCRLSKATFSGQMVATKRMQRMALTQFVEKILRESDDSFKAAIKESGYLVQVGKDILPILLGKASFGKLLSPRLIHRYLVWNWWRVCDRYVPSSWRCYLQPKVPVLQRHLQKPW